MEIAIGMVSRELELRSANSKDAIEEKRQSKNMNGTFLSPEWAQVLCNFGGSCNSFHFTSKSRNRSQPAGEFEFHSWKLRSSSG